MTPHFLGGYLLAAGAVTPEQLAMAMARLTLANRKVGELALGLNLLTSEQVEDILRQQADTDLNFGELALAKGYLNKNALNDLLYHQNVHQVHLGEALLENGVLTPHQYQAILERFLLDQAGHQNVLNALLTEFAEHQILSTLLLALERAFARFVGLPLKTRVDLPGQDTAARPRAFSLCATGPDQQPMHFSLDMDDQMLAVIGRGFQNASPEIIAQDSSADGIPDADPGSAPPSTPAQALQDGPQPVTGHTEAVEAFFRVVSRYFNLNLPPTGQGTLLRTLEDSPCQPDLGCTPVRLSLVCPVAAMGFTAACTPAHSRTAGVSA